VNFLFFTAPTGHTGDILRYNTTNDTWEKLVYFQSHRRGHSCVFDSKRREILVFFGAASDDGNIERIRPERYYVGNNTVQTRPSWPGAVTNHGVGSTAVYDADTDKIYIMGGEAYPTGLSILSQTTGWTNGSKLSTAASWGSAIIIEGEIWYFSAASLQIYNIANDTWRSDDMTPVMSQSSSNNAPISPPNIHLFTDVHTIVTCALPCPALASPCLKNTCDYLTGTCSAIPANEGDSCNANDCTGSNCICTAGSCSPDSSR
jgi:hypothetical protein